MDDDSSRQSAASIGIDASNLEAVGSSQWMPQFFSTWGPRNGPIRWRDLPPSLGVVDSPGTMIPIGIAFPVEAIPDPLGSPPAAAFRLKVGETWRDGFYVCHGRRFVPLDSWRSSRRR